MPRFVVDELAAHLRDFPSSDGFVFSMAGGGPIQHRNFYRRHFRPAIAASELPDRLRFHDLRHTFVVRRILLWQQKGIDVDEAMLSLSTYVGHAMVTNTYWYLQAVPELMAVAAQRFESCMPELSHA